MKGLDGLMEATLNWSGNVAFSGKASSGHEIKIDGAEKIGGNRIPV